LIQTNTSNIATNAATNDYQDISINLLFTKDIQIDTSINSLEASFNSLNGSTTNINNDITIIDNSLTIIDNSVSIINSLTIIHHNYLNNLDNSFHILIDQVAIHDNSINILESSLDALEAIQEASYNYIVNNLIFSLFDELNDIENDLITTDNSVNSVITDLSDLSYSVFTLLPPTLQHLDYSITLSTTETFERLYQHDDWTGAIRPKGSINSYSFNFISIVDRFQIGDLITFSPPGLNPSTSVAGDILKLRVISDVSNILNFHTDSNSVIYKGREYQPNELLQFINVLDVNLNDVTGVRNIQNYKLKVISVNKVDTNTTPTHEDLSNVSLISSIITDVSNLDSSVNTIINDICGEILDKRIIRNATHAQDGLHINFNASNNSNSAVRIYDGNNNVRMYLHPTNGRIGINTTSPSYGLDINHDVQCKNLNQTANSALSTSGTFLNFLVNRTSSGGSNGGMFFNYGAAYGYGLFPNGAYHQGIDLGRSARRWRYVNCVSLTQSSDDRLKINERPITNALTLLENLNFYEYEKVKTLNGTDVMNTERGVLAQDILKTDISYSVSGGGLDESGNEVSYDLKYNDLIMTACQALKDQSLLIKSLQSRIESLENK